MTVAGLILNIGLLLGLVAGIAILKLTGVLDVIIASFDWVKYFISWLTNNKIFMVMFFIFLVAVFGSMITFLLGLNYSCDSQNNLREQKYGVLSGISFMIASASKGINSTEDPQYTQLLEDYTVPTQTYSTTSAESVMAVNCIASDPKLMLFGKVDFLNYRYWVLIMVISGVLGAISTMRQWNW